MTAKFSAMESWIQSVAYARSGSKNTEINYRRSLTYFCEFIEKTPEQILLEYEASDDRAFRRKYARFLRAFIAAMTAKGYTKGTVRLLAASVQSFFKYSDLPLAFIPKATLNVVYHNRDITAEEIGEILSVSTPRERAFYTIMTQSGLRPHVLCTLRKKHLEPLDKVPCKIEIPKELAKGEYMEHFSFIGEEALTYLRNYLKTRPNLTEDSYLFSTYGHEAQLARNTISNSFHRTVVQLKKKGIIDFESKKGKPSGVRLYNLRKYFRKMAGHAGADFVNFWMGHTSALGVDLRYFSKDPEHHRKQYIEKAMPHLRLGTETPTDFEKLLAERDGEIAALKKAVQKQDEKLEYQWKALTQANKDLQRDIKFLRESFGLPTGQEAESDDKEKEGET